jgi:hypothetical protein
MPEQAWPAPPTGPEPEPVPAPSGADWVPEAVRSAEPVAERAEPADPAWVPAAGAAPDATATLPRGKHRGRHTGVLAVAAVAALLAAGVAVAASGVLDKPEPNVALSVPEATIAPEATPTAEPTPSAADDAKADLARERFDAAQDTQADRAEKAYIRSFLASRRNIRGQANATPVRTTTTPSATRRASAQAPAATTKPQTATKPQTQVQKPAAPQAPSQPDPDDGDPAGRQPPG